MRNRSLSWPGKPFEKVLVIQYSQQCSVLALLQEFRDFITSLNEMKIRLNWFAIQGTILHSSQQYTFLLLLLRLRHLKDCADKSRESIPLASIIAVPNLVTCFVFPYNMKQVRSKTTTN